MFEDAPALGTARHMNVQHRWHSLDLLLEFTSRRTSTRLRDSVASDGREYAIVHEQATFDIVEVRPRGGFTYSAGALSFRDTIHASSNGTRIVSLKTARAVVMWDTSTISGRHVRRDIDGVALPYRTANKQTRELRWESDAEERDRRTARAKEHPFSMDDLPINPLYARMLRGDVQLRDSLLKGLAKPLQFGERDWALSLLKDEPGVVISRRWEDSVALRAGDTAWVVQRILKDHGEDTTTGGAITAELWRLSLPFMRNRRYAWDRGVDSWGLAGRIADILQKAPPAFTRDRALWPCDSTTCELIAREYQSSRVNPIAPAAEVGLAMQALLRPSSWADSVLAHGSDAPLLTGLRNTIIGDEYGATPAPEVSAPWREWMFWKYGIKSDSAFERRNAESQIFGGARGRSAGAVLRWRAARTGVDHAGILSRRYATAVNDNERIVYASLLNDIDQLRDSLMDVSRMITSNNLASQTIAKMQLERLRRSATSPDNISLSEIRATVIRKFASRSATDDSSFRQFLEFPSATIGDSIRLAQAGVTLVSSSWQPPKDHSSVRTRVTVEQLGPFAWVTYGQRNFVRRRNGVSFENDQWQRTVLHRSFDFWQVVDERYEEDRR